ncbi:MAG: PepSY-associated TM helix domain-containing protein [Pseudomonadota bacterium]
MTSNYAAMWRWHFYAGVVVIPLLLVLAATGLVMAVGNALSPYHHRDLFYVSEDDVAIAPSAQVATVIARYPKASVAVYVPPRASNRSAEVVISAADDASLPPWQQPTLSVFVDPYRAEIVGTLDRATTYYAIAKKIHGSLMLGQAGDYIVEAGASLAVLLVLTGICLWFPRNQTGGWLTPRRMPGGRSFLRSVHGSLGFWLAPILLFFLISGLAWTPIWGEKLTQAWSAFPAERMRAPTSTASHKHQNHGGKIAPWVLEQTALPASTPLDRVAEGSGVGLDDVVSYARKAGFDTFRVILPKGDMGAWTISAVTMSGDVSDPRLDRTLHMDRYSGEVLADVDYSQYSIPGKLMATSIAIHQADIGSINLAFNVLLCVGVISLAVTACLMWWKRRPKMAGYRLMPPGKVSGRTATVVMMLLLVVSTLFPLAFAVLCLVMILDILLVSRLAILRNLLK